MLYGTTLRLPGEYFIDEQVGPEPQIFIEKFRVMMRNMRSAPAVHHCRVRPFAHKTLHTCTHVFVREDKVKKPLEAPYRGPYAIIEKLSDYVFKIDLDGTPTTISTERLKPAFFEAETWDKRSTATEVTTPVVSQSADASASVLIPDLLTSKMQSASECLPVPIIKPAVSATQLQLRTYPPARPKRVQFVATHTSRHSGGAT